jgi:hypothetical protein
VRLETIADPVLREPTDGIVRVKPFLDLIAAHVQDQSFH